jgi:pimeloyl-ACP methyl ester carboxylesterase
MSNLPVLVFIPGSWHKPTCYNKITKILQDRHKLKCVLVTLPSTTGNPAATFKDDVDAAREAISNEFKHEHNVVVIAHSYGGMVGNSAIKDFAQPRDAIASRSAGTPASAPAQVTGQSQIMAAGHVIGLVLIASGFTFTGVAFMDPFLGRPPPSWRVNSETGFAELVTSPREMFYHDVPADEAEYWVSQLTPQSLKSLFEGGEFSYAGWIHVPVWYIGTVEDRGLPVAMQRMSVGMAREMGCHVEHRELQSSHSPFLSQPEETAGIVVEAVEAFTGKQLEKLPSRGEQRKEVAVPAFRLWQPLTWYRFGLPLVFGHMVGRGILIFGRVRGLWRRSV